MATWFTSDTHLGHANILRLSERPFATIDEHDEFIIERWNSVVGKHDTVWHLGDVALGTIAESLPKVGRLNGHKFLLSGNHDRTFADNKQAQRDKFTPVYQQYFDWCFGGAILLALADSTVVRMCHFPYSGDSHDEDRFPEHRPTDDGKWLLHGHIHQKWRVNGRQINVGVDVWDFRPVPEQTIIDIIRDNS